ncbi:MAG: multicopper oxidase domain-containing protein [Cyanobacteriota bacterium]|nr:multicopper oxidase domain-containing protein [Cyanobacteriota bacterium]
MAIEYFQPQYSPFRVAKWVDKLPIPQVLKPRAVGNNNQPWGNKPPALYTDVDPQQHSYHGIAPEYFNRKVAGTTIPYYQTGQTAWYDLFIRPSSHTFFNDVELAGASETLRPISSPIVGYNGITPGPLFKTRVGRPVVVRNYNQASEHFSTHLHGGHNAAHADGFPTFVVEPGKYRDHYYANTVPMKNGKPDFSEAPSTMWYHDHGIDLTEKHVLEGTAGMWLTFDDRELNLIKNKVLPGWGGSPAAWKEATFMSQPSRWDIPLVLADKRFNANGTLHHDPLEFDGQLGDIETVNGKAYPTLTVQPTKYRFRILDGSIARFYNLQLSDNYGGRPPFIGLGSDTWLYPKAIRQNNIFLTPAQRADVVIDFSKYKAGDVVYLENIMEQTDGRGPKGTPLDPRPLLTPDRLLKFEVAGPKVPPAQIPKVVPGTPLRPHSKIDPTTIAATRTFEFSRRNGHWQINQVDYVPEHANFTPSSGGAERWIFRNNSGGWAHPVHVHLESQQVESYNGQAPLPQDRAKRDTIWLTPNGEVSVLMHFRTFEGPFVLHCHILGHEDLMMMLNFDPTVAERPDGVPISRNYAPPAFNPYVHHEPQGIDTTDITNTTELAASLNALTRRSSRKGRGASGRGSKGHRGHRGHAGHRGHIRQRFVLADERQSDRPTDDFRRDSLISGGERRRQRQPRGGPGRDADRHRIAGLSGSDALLSSSRSWLDALAEANPLGQLAAQEALTTLS